ncbi:MAG: nucleotide exchange factor GrpE [Proteobacteria bacterium]|nr:nucleotide exchange factor GrpE [Pseudomonadota bacterium]
MSEHKKKHPSQHPDTKQDAAQFEDENLLESRLVPEDASLPSPDDIAELHRQIATMGAALKEEQEKAANNWDRLLRKEADLQNLQKRSQEEIEKTRKFAIEKFALEILEVLDSLEHGLNFAKEGKVDAASLLEGMQMTHSILLNALDKHGIKPINPLNETFNPSFHEAISVQETKEVPPNQVLAVVQKGYILNNRLLRPARVVVSRAVSS